MTEKLFLKGLYILSKKWRGCLKGNQVEFEYWDAQLTGFLVALDGMEISRRDFNKRISQYDGDLADLEWLHGELIYDSKLKGNNEIFEKLKVSQSIKLW